MSQPTSIVTLAERVHAGLLAALWLEPDVAAELALPGGVPAEDLHITLCSCPAADDELTTARAIAAIERTVTWRSGVEGRVGGYGRFFASESSDGQDVFHASVDVPGLVDLRSAVEYALYEAQCPPSTEHGYAPHITLAYLEPDDDNPVERLAATKLAFKAVTIMVGERRIDIPFSPALAFAEPSERRADRGVGKNGCQFHDYRRPVTLKGADEWVQFLPPPGTYHHVLYGDLDLTTEKYGLMVSNFATGIYGQTLPINCEHDMPASGAVGYIADMRIAEDGSIEVKPEWNERGTALLEGDRFRYVSAEFFDSWQDPVTGAWHDDVAFGMAICTNPHFKETVLRPLAASETRPAIQPAERREGTSPMTNTHTDQNTPDDTPVTVTLTEDEVTRLREADRRLTAAEQRAETAEGQVSQLTERVTTMEREARHKRFTDLAAGRGGSNDGGPWFGDPAGHVSTLEMLADIGGEEGEEVKRYTEQQNAIANQLKDSRLFTEIGSSQSGEIDVDSKVASLVARKREQDPGLTIEQAEARVYDENPGLYAEATNGAH